MRRKNLAMTLIDYRKAYRMVPQTVQDIQPSHWIHCENHKKPESEIDSRRKKSIADFKILRDTLIP